MTRRDSSYDRDEAARQRDLADALLAAETGEMCIVADVRGYGEGANADQPPPWGEETYYRDEAPRERERRAPSRQAPPPPVAEPARREPEAPTHGGHYYPPRGTRTGQRPTAESASSHLQREVPVRSHRAPAPPRRTRDADRQEPRRGGGQAYPTRRAERMRAHDDAVSYRGAPRGESEAGAPLMPAVGWKPVAEGYKPPTTYRPRAEIRHEQPDEPESLRASLVRWSLLFLVIILIAFALVTLMDRSVSSPRESFFSHASVIMVPVGAEKG